MSGAFEPRDDAALWRRWRMAADEVAPDFATLAAYAEGRLDAAERAAVERWLAIAPETVADLAAARQPAETAIADEAVERLVARAAALVAAPSATVVPLRAAPRPVRRWAEWAAVAASFFFVSWLGFSLGTNLSADLISAEAAPSTELQDVFDPPSILLGTFADQSSG